MSEKTPAFRQGVEPGGMFDKDDVRLLILCALADRERPVSKDALVGGLFGAGLANYFELSAAAEELAEQGLAAVAQRTETGELLTVTARGRETAEALSDRIPKTTRERAAESIQYFETAEKRRRENSVEVRKNGGTVAVTLNAGTPDDRLMSLTVYVPDGELGDMMKKKMTAEPEKLCEKILRLLTED